MDRKADEILGAREIRSAIDRALANLASRQHDDGSWQGDYGGVLFLIPMYIIACHVAGEPVEQKDAGLFIAYYRKVQNGDGSVGMHPHDTGRMFTTVMSYVALRILGCSRDSEHLVPMRKWIRDRGGALGAASWGKSFLALMNLCPYEGLNPILPELWVLPRRLPFHPSRFWCHSRMVYLPMAMLYALRATIPENDFIRELRADIYTEKYEAIDFAAHRNTLCPEDCYRPYSKLFMRINTLLCAYEKRHSKFIRKKAIASVYRHILYEERSTFYFGIGPVNRILNTVAHSFVDRRGLHFRLGVDAMKKYRFYSPEGLKINGYNSTALWDTAFAVQSIYETDCIDEYRDTLVRAYEFIRDNQITAELPRAKKFHRQNRAGAWPFSDRDQGWPVTDCTAEGYIAQSLVRGLVEPDERVSEENLSLSIRFILKYQNSDGGWATYEKRRGRQWLEMLNPSSVFADIMIDHSHVECTASCLKLLSREKTKYDGNMRRKIDRAIRRGAAFLLEQQQPEGGFRGAWAVCFTYGTWFAVNGLMAAGLPENSPAITRACVFLMGKQRDDGSWGESHLSCLDGRWIDHNEGQAVNTAWALMTLLDAGLGSSEAAHRAVRFLIRRQTQKGDWPEESIVGLFNNTALVNYDNYRRYFPLMALARYLRAADGHSLH